MQRGKSAKQEPDKHVDADGAEDARELGRLQTRLRLLEKDREVNRNQARQKISKQEKEIERLVNEQDHLQRELGMRNGAYEQNKDQDNVEKLKDLVEYSGNLDEELAREAFEQQQLKVQISEMEVKLSKLRKDGANPKDRLMKKRRELRTIRVLEDKLQRAVRQLNEQMCKNSELREEVQTTLKARARFQTLYKGLCRENEETQRQLKEVTEQYLKTCESSVEAHTKRVELSKSRGKERTEYNAEMQRLQMITADKQNLREFLLSKHGDREGRLVKSHTEVTMAREMQDSQDSLREVFDRIRTVTGLDDLDTLLQGFIQAEDQNFALFNFVNEQNKEIEALWDEIEQIQDETQKFKVRSQQCKLSHRAKMEEIAAQRKRVEARTALYENQAHAKRRALEQIKRGVKRICSKIGCDSDSNITSDLGAVEERTNKMLNVKAWVEMISKLQ